MYIHTHAYTRFSFWYQLISAHELKYSDLKTYTIIYYLNPLHSAEWWKSLWLRPYKNLLQVKKKKGLHSSHKDLPIYNQQLHPSCLCSSNANESRRNKHVYLTSTSISRIQRKVNTFFNAPSVLVVRMLKQEKNLKRLKRTIKNAHKSIRHIRTLQKLFLHKDKLTH